MAILSKEEAKEILEKVVKLSRADECIVNLSGSKGGNIRYARNEVSTSGEETNLSLSVQSTFGTRTGTSSINEFDDESLEKVIRRAEELAELAPENPEFVSALEPQEYVETPTFFDSTEGITAADRAEAAANSIAPTEGKDVGAAGFLEDSAGFQAIMNSKGLFAYNKSSSVDFTVTMRTSDGTGSGWVTRDFNDFSKLNTKEASEVAMEKARNSSNAQAVEPGRYTVILEPAAGVDLLRNMLGSMGARQADEGRSFLSKGGDGNKVGEKLLDERVTIYSDPSHPDAPFAAFSGDGVPNKETYWFENGVVKNMFYDRFWAQEKGKEPLNRPYRAVMEGGDKSVEEMIKGTERGILVTRLWYIRSVDPQSLLYTGLTRDGTFYIENGEIKFPVKNFRFNESPIIMLNNLEELGKPVRVSGSLVPPMKIRDFTFTSLSDAV